MSYNFKPDTLSFIQDINTFSLQALHTEEPPPPQRKNKQLTFLSKPYAIAAAVGSLIIRRTFKPAIVPASFVACL